MGANNSFYVKSIATYAPTCFGYVNLVLANVIRMVPNLHLATINYISSCRSRVTQTYSRIVEGSKLDRFLGSDKRTFQNINQENYGQCIFSTSFIDYPKDVQLFLTMAIATDRLILQGP